MSDNREEATGGGLLLTRVIESLDAGSRTAMRSRVMQRIAAEGVRKRAGISSRRAITWLALISTLFSGFAVATAASVPGDILHAVKLAAEEAHLSMIPAADRPDALVDVAGHRLDEIDRILDRSQDGRLDRAVEGFGEAAQRAVVEPDSPADAERVREHIVERVGQEDEPVQNAVGDRVPQVVSPGPGDGSESPGAAVEPEGESTQGAEKSQDREQLQTETQGMSGSPEPEPSQSSKP